MLPTKERRSMGKSKTEIEDIRRNRVTVRFNDFEFEQMQARAKEANLPLATYIQRQAVYNDIVRSYPVVFDSEDLKKIVHEIGKIGINLNQIALHLNTGGSRSLAIENDIHECVAKLREMRQEVLRLGGDYSGSTKTHRKQKR